MFTSEVYLGARGGGGGGQGMFTSGVYLGARVCLHQGFIWGLGGTRVSGVYLGARGDQGIRGLSGG